MEKRTGIQAWLRPERLIWLLLAALAVERIWVFFELGVDYRANADDTTYVLGGLLFAKTGILCYKAPCPTALIMPAMPVIIGLYSYVFGEGLALWTALRFTWCALGVLTAWYAYQTVRLLGSTWGGVLAAAAFLLPNMAWMNHVVQTETPYMLFFVMSIYYTFCMEKFQDRKYFAAYLGSFMAALLFRSNAITIPLFTALYLLLRKQDRRLLLRRGLVFCGVLLLFLVPWTIRNYIQFDAFIPLTYGAGDPMRLGTYQGEGFPKDEELDYETNVEAVLREKYARYFNPEPQPHPEAADPLWADYLGYDPNGELREVRHAEYIGLQRNSILARYRMKVWFERDPVSFLKSYLLIKPRWMINWTWIWREVLSVSYETLHRISQLNFLFCGLTVLLSLLLKKYRAPIFFMGLVYFANVYITAMAFVSDRYGSMLMPLRYMIAGLGFQLLWEAARRLLAGRRKKTEQA